MEDNRYFLSNSHRVLSVLCKNRVYSVFINYYGDTFYLQDEDYRNIDDWLLRNNTEVSKKIAWLLCPHAFTK